jgi:hypothetical protein
MRVAPRAKGDFAAMKSNRARFLMLVVGTLAFATSLYIPGAKAQGKPKQSKTYVEFPGGVSDCSEDSSSGRKDYCINVVSLTTSNTEMFWRQSDTFRITLLNNPFLYTYKLEVNDTPIAEDDVLAKFESLLGLSAPKSSTPNTKGTGGALNEIVGFDQGTKAVCRLDRMQRAADRAAEFWKNHGNNPANIEQGLSKKETDYDKFQESFLAVYHVLRNQKTPIPQVEEQAKQLEQSSLATFNLLVNDASFEQEFVDFGRDASATISDLKSETDCTPRPAPKVLDPRAEKKLTNTEKEERKAKQAEHEQVVALQSDLQSEIDRVTSAVSQVSFTLCVYQHRKQGEFLWVKTGVLDPLAKVLGNPDSFRSSTNDLGPYVSPTESDISLTRTPIMDEVEGSVSQTDNSLFECSNDPQTLLQASKLSRAEILAAPKSAQPQCPSDCTTQKNAGVSRTGATNTGTKTTDNVKNPDQSGQAKVLQLKQPLLFGGPRFVVAGGLMTGFLRKKEFQRSFGQPLDAQGNPVIGAQPAAVIGLKTDSDLRLAPMLFAHTRITMLPRWRSEAFFASLGVTAHSDNQGTDPEFFVGGSVSFAQSKFFLSAGTYIGKQQSLDGGLFVGQAIPSGLTGELPVRKSYRAGFGIALSYRFLAAADPKKPTDTSSKTGSSPKK